MKIALNINYVHRVTRIMDSMLAVHGVVSSERVISTYLSPDVSCNPWSRSDRSQAVT